LSQDEIIQLVREKKVHMHIVIADSKKISQTAMEARMHNGFADFIAQGNFIHTWFMGKE